MKTKRVAFIGTSPNHMRLHKRFIERVKEEPEYGIEIISIDMQLKLDELIGLRSASLLLRSLASNVVKVLGRNIIKFALNIYIKNCIYLYIKSLNVDAIVLCDNYYTYIHSVIISAANKLNIKILCIPFVNQDIEDIKISRFNSSIVKRQSVGVMAFIVKRIFPSWVCVYRGNEMLWAHPFDILGMRMLGLLPDNPIEGIANYVDAVLISGEIAKSRFMAYGAKEKNLYQIGDIMYDFAYKSSCSIGISLDTNANARKGRPTAVFSLCPDLCRKIVYKNYEGYIYHYAGIINKLRSAGWNVFVSIHPSAQDYVHELLISKGVDIMTEDISHMIGRADVYFSSYSSTILLASYIGAKVIDHDIYDIGYVGNDKIPDVMTVKKPSDVDIFVDQLLPFSQAHHLKKAQGPLVDGKVLERFISFL